MHIPDPASGTRRAVLVLAAGLVVVTLSACGASRTPSLPEEYLGRWYYMGSTGGISGQGIGDEPTGYLLIHSDNTMDHHAEDGSLIRTTEFSVDRGPTIFSSEDQWILNRESTTPEVIMASEGGQTMTISENVYDGFGRTYARSR